MAALITLLTISLQSINSFVKPDNQPAERVNGTQILG